MQIFYLGLDQVLNHIGFVGIWLFLDAKKILKTKINVFFFLIYIFFGDNEIFMILDLMAEEERVILDFEFHMRRERERELL